MNEILRDPRLNLNADAPSELIESQLDSYLDLLVKWNRKINLTSEKTPSEILHRHIFDSLQYARVITPNDQIIDIGSGAGFPGIPLKIVYPHLILTLIESQRKRCSFLEAVVSNLGLQDTRVINERAEKISPVPMVGVVILRAVSNIKSCLDLGVRFLEQGGKVVLKKGPEENMAADPPHGDFSLIEEVGVTGYNGKKSILLVFEKCST
ncbi:16S rRNA (guanine(527)-N(7))-methyltransferase RsmG [Nitrospina gracilis]|nr:16S rRNA (guanine(527)-N(7))-methyltransferase RsmG [Nitrospina gracilis]